MIILIASEICPSLWNWPSEKKNNRIKELEPRVKSAAEAINSLKDIIKKKDDEIKTQEEKYKRFLGKAKQVSRVMTLLYITYN